MSIHAISGKPGGGKTMYSVKLILDELLHGTRVIITNVGLNLASLNEYIQREYPSKAINLFERIILIDEEQMGVFFTIRPPGSVGPSVLTKEQWQKGENPDYTKIKDAGVLYVLDEIHIKFNARAWMNTGQDVLYYLSQHRKLGDDVVWITQAINNVDKQFRSVTQDYTFIRNLAKERMSHFRLPSVFTRQTYTSPPTDTTTPMETGSFRMDVTGLASLYDTAKGVGIHGRNGADTTERKKGLPWWVGVGIIVLIVALAFMFVPKLIASVFSPKVQTPKLPAQQPHTNAVQQNYQEKKVQPTELLLRSNIEPQTNTPPQVVAVDRLTGVWRVILSTGEIYYQGEPELQEINQKRGVLISGKWLTFKNVKPTDDYQPTKPLEYIQPEPTERIIHYKVVKQ